MLFPAFIVQGRVARNLGDKTVCVSELLFSAFSANPVQSLDAAAVVELFLSLLTTIFLTLLSNSSLHFAPSIFLSGSVLDRQPRCLNLK